MSRAFKIVVVLLIILLAIIIAYNYLTLPSSPACPIEGTAREYSVQQLNRLKNRTKLPPEDDIDRSITLETMLAPGYDRDRFSSGKALELTAYVRNVKPGEKETCNCESENPDDWDTHIELVTDPQQVRGFTKVIVEVTPALRRQMAASGKDWSTEALKYSINHKWVKVKGWLMFDFEHERQAQNTNPEGKRNWRATCWEIHPVTSIEIIEKPVQ